jgi:hypothetical protein
MIFEHLALPANRNIIGQTPSDRPLPIGPNVAI